MKREKISMVIGELDTRHIEDALDCEKHIYFEGWTKWQKAVACAVLAVFCFLGMTGIAFASNTEFREMVVNFISGFSEEEKVQIKNGHATAVLDKTDVLVGFLHDFNDNDMGNGVKAEYGEDGFNYVVFYDNGKNANVIVNCESEQLKLLVNMAGEEIEKGINAWKIKSYKLISYDEADKMLHSFSGESETAAFGSKVNEALDKTGDSVILTDKQRGKIYNALHKEKQNIVTLTKKETKTIKSVFESYTNDEIGWEGQEYNYIILFDDVDYMMTEDGFVVKENKNATIAFKMKGRDLKKVIKVFEKYKIKF